MAVVEIPQYQAQCDICGCGGPIADSPDAARKDAKADGFWIGRRRVAQEPRVLCETHKPERAT